MKEHLTKEEKKARDSLERISAAIRTQYSFHKIKSFYDLLRAVGYDEKTIKEKYFPSEYEKPLTFQDVQEYLSDRRIELTTAQFLARNPPITNNHESIHNIQQDNIIDRQIITSNRIENDINKIRVDKKEESFIHSPNEIAYLFWFQKQAITKLMKGILGEE
jgi:hypothetical protein